MTYQCRRQCGRYCWRHCWTQRGRIRLITTIVRVITQLPDWLLLSRTFMLLTTNNLGRWGRTHEHDWNCNCTEEFHCEWIDRTLSWNLEIDVHLRSCRLDCVSDYETLVLIRGHPAATQLCWPRSQSWASSPRLLCSVGKFSGAVDFAVPFLSSFFFVA